MSTHDEARRAFLIGAVVGAGTAAGLVTDAAAQGLPPEKPPADAAGQPRASSIGDSARCILNAEDAANRCGLRERLNAGAPGKPVRARCARLPGSIGGRFLRRKTLRGCVGHKSRGRSGPNHCADQECAASFVMRAHAFIPQRH